MAVKRGLLSDTDSLFIAKIRREFAVGLPDPWAASPSIWCSANLFAVRIRRRLTGVNGQSCIITVCFAELSSVL